MLEGGTSTYEWVIRSLRVCTTSGPSILLEKVCAQQQDPQRLPVGRRWAEVGGSVERMQTQKRAWLSACLFAPGLSELAHLCKDKVLPSSAPAEHSFPSCLATGWLDAETKQGATKQHEKKGSKRSAFKNIARTEISSLFRGRRRGIDQRKLNKKTSSIGAESEPDRRAEPTVLSCIHSNSSKQFLPALSQRSTEM